MSEHENAEPPAKYSYAVGGGLGLLVGVLVGLIKGNFLVDAGLGIAIGVVVSFIVRQFQP